MDARAGGDGGPAVDFTWLTGPAEGTYGFTIGPARLARDPDDEGGLTRAQVEQTATDFVRVFFAEGGIGPSEFADFVAERRASGR